MKIKIIHPEHMGLLPKYEGKEFEATRINNGYKLDNFWPGSITQPHIDDRWISSGYAELAEFEMNICGWAVPYGIVP